MSLLRRIGSTVLASLGIMTAAAQTPGVTPTEIRIGNTNPYTGPVSSYGTIGRTVAAYFRMVNDAGGINGRQVVFISYDDGYSPPRTIEQVRRLVEQDDVLLIFQSIGTEPNRAIRDYLNAAGVPQLFIGTGASAFVDPARYPWTLPWNPSFETEGQIYGRYIRETFPGEKVGILYQNDELGLDYLRGITDGIAGASEIVARPYDVTDATVDAQIAALAMAGATVFFNASTPRFATLAIQRAFEIGWRPHHILANVSNSVSGVLVPAGVEASTGILTAGFMKDPGFPEWADAPDIIAYHAFLRAHYPEGDPRGVFEVYGYATATALAEVLRRAGDDLSRENIMQLATSLAGLEVPGLMPGITLNTGPDDHRPIEQLRMMRFDGASFVPFGDLIGAAR